MAKVNVTNTGNRTRIRLGTRLAPGESKTFDVNARGRIALNAVRDFTVEPIEEEKQPAGDQNDQDVLKEKLAAVNIDGALTMVKGGELSVDEAIALETVGKNRATLIEQLEHLKKSGE